MAQARSQGQSQPGQQSHDQRGDNSRTAQGLVVEDGRLHRWCKEGKLKKVNQFIRTCEDLPPRLAYRRGVFGYAPLHEAVSNGHTNVLEVLIKHKSDVNARANGGYTPLHLAASGGHVECVRMLLDKGADVANTDEYGKTPKQTAELNSKHSVLKILRSAGEYVL